MSLLFFVLLSQLLVTGSNGSDRQLKEGPKTKQAIVVNNENTTAENAATFAPPIELTDDNGERTQPDTIDYCSSDFDGCGDVGPDTVLPVRRFNNSDEPESFFSDPETNRITSDDESMGELNDDMTNDKTRKDATVTESTDEVVTNTQDTESLGNRLVDNTMTLKHSNEIPVQFEQQPYLN